MTRRLLVVAAIVCGLLALAVAVTTWRLARPRFSETLASDPAARLAIAPVDAALTLARVRPGEGGHVVLVTGAEGGGVRAVDLHAYFERPFRDAVEAAASLGFDALAEAARRGPSTLLSLAQLGLPVDLAHPHVAAGANYRAHAEEVGVEDGPFLFPKLSHATAWDADVPARGRLDYEAEICAVTLSAHTAVAPARLGFLICNDFTDRWMLVRQIDLDAPMGTTGFPDAKGGDGMLPVGPLLVVPRAAGVFHRGLALELWVGGALRQRERADRMIWSPREIADRALASCDTPFQSAGDTIPLTDCSGIPARTLLLTGTPAGVMFHPITLWARWAYLQPGDEVVTFEPSLGVLRNRIR